MVKVEYVSNNSGGDWWLDDAAWKALADAGWSVDWFAEREPGPMGAFAPDAEGRWLRALAKSASKEFPSLGDGINEWERITGQASNDLGCSCCGPPHYFSTDEGIDYSPDYPTSGERYGA